MQSEHFESERIPGIRLHALHWGERGQRPLVLLHGGGANAHWWCHLAPDLTRNTSVVALDFRGHGASRYPEELEVGAFNNDLEGLLDHLGREDAILVGHSMGGAIALDHAARHPQIRGLALLDVSAGASRRSRRVARLALMLRRTYATREEAVARFNFLPRARGADEALRASIARASVCETDDGRYGFAFDPRWFGIPSRPRPDLSRVTCPTLLIRGQASELLTPDGATALLGELPNAEFAEIPGAGHHVQLEQPAAVLEALQRFLEPLV